MVESKKYQKSCEYCSETFRTNLDWQKFCSFDCRKNWIREYSPHYEDYRNRQEIRCIQCGDMFKPKQPRQKFCSEECRVEKRDSGMNLLEPLIREYFLERDNYTCQDCGATKLTFDIHHIEPLYQGGSHEEENLIVLCRECHKGRHKIW